MTGIELLEQARPHAPERSSCSSRRTPTPTSRSRRSTTSGSTTTCSSPGTRPRSGSTPSSTTCSSDWRQAATPTTTVRRAGRRPPLVGAQPRGQDVPRPQPRAVPLVRPRARRRGAAARRRWPARRPTTCRSCSCPTARRCGPRRRCDLATALGLRTTADRSRSTTCASSAAARPGSRPRCTARRRGSRPSSSNGRRRAARPGRARRSRTTSASRRGCPAPTSPIGPSRRSRRFGAEMVLARDVVGFEARGPVRAVLLDDGGEIEARAVIVATGVSYRRLEAPGSRSSPARASTTAPPPARPPSAQGEDVYVVGAANSAGQAALNLARFAKRVVLLVVRGPSLEQLDVAATWSSGSASHPNIEVRLNAEVARRTWRRPPRAPHPRATGATGATEDVRRAGCSCSSAPRPAPTGSGDDGRRATSTGFVVTGQRRSATASRSLAAGRARRSRSRPASRASSRPATCGSTR